MRKEWAGPKRGRGWPEWERVGPQSIKKEKEIGK